MANSKLMGSRTYSGTFPSPETPPCAEDDDPSIEIPKGWSSERVPRYSYRTRRYVAAAALMPFSSGRTLPSKWEDAERWICSPVSLGNISTNSNYCYYGGGPGAGSRTAAAHLTYHQRRAKSKSGPLGPVGPEYYGGGYNSFSPVLGVGVINGGTWRNSLTIEPSGLASARFEERLPIEGDGGGEEARRSCPGHATHWLESWSGPPSPTQVGLETGEMSLNGENNEVLENNLEQENDNGEVGVDRAISRRDMATQMFPQSSSKSTSSASSSPKSPISNTSPRLLLFNESRRDAQTSEYEVRDVQVDKQTSRHDMKDNYSNDYTSIEVDNRFSKFERKEARINAWENLQKAKAEAAIQKLEEKLEKKRASSINKIMRKLRKAEVRAEKMRNIISSDGDHTESQTISKTSKIPLFCRIIRLNSSTKNSATCYPF